MKDIITFKKLVGLQKDITMMGQIKSDFDCEKFTVGKEGSFIACQYHFLMRQYRFALEEKERIELEMEEIERWIEALKDEEIRRKKFWHKVKVSTKKTKKKLKKIENIDVEIRKGEVRIISLEVDSYAKKCAIEKFEKLRLKIIVNNGGKTPTNEQYQSEQPAYYKWLLYSKALRQLHSKAFGIDEGTLDAISMGAREPILEDSKMKIPHIIDKTGALSIGNLLQEYFRENENFLEKSTGDDIEMANDGERFLVGVKEGVKES